MSRGSRLRHRGLRQAEGADRVVEQELAAITGAEGARLDEHLAWVDRHPEAVRRLDQLTTEIDALDPAPRAESRRSGASRRG
ncbi:MAG: hypothetical protein M3198_17235 [Actinomycetota bacterium]|nr:hypothetical protein [Actinomycetota bacterium]